MRAAMLSQKITPKNEFYMVGYVSKERELPAAGVHDDPYCIVLLLEIEDTQFLFISLDVCMVEKKKTDEIKAEIGKFLPISPEYITINATHTHSAANGMDSHNHPEHDNPAYYDLVKTVIVETVRCLPAHLEVVTAKFKSTPVRGFYGNRNQPDGPFDDEGAMLLLYNAQNKVVAAMGNINCHCTVLGPQNRLASSDLIGEVRRNLAKRLEVLPYIFTGSSGDISNRHFRKGNDFNELERVGKGVADILTLNGRYDEITLSPVEVHTFSYPVAYDNTAYYPEYQAMLTRIQKELEADDLLLDQRKLLLSEKRKLNMKLQLQREEFTIHCKQIRLGALQFVTFPGELFSKFGSKLKKSAGCHTLIIGYADDYCGYFVPAEEYRKIFEAVITRMPKNETEKLIAELEKLV